MAPVSHDFFAVQPAQRLLPRSEDVFTALTGVRLQELTTQTAYSGVNEQLMSEASLEKVWGMDDDTQVEVPIFADDKLVLDNLGAPNADDIIQAIKDWFVQLFQTVTGVGNRIWQPIADKIGEAAGRVDDFVKTHPKEIAYTIGGLLLTVALIIFCGPAILGILGFGVWGPIAGSLVALLQSIAMGGSTILVANLQVTAVIAFIVGLGLILYFALHA